MKKSKFFASALAAMMCATSILGLVACSKEAESGGSADQPVTPAVYTVTYNANGGTFGSGVATAATTVNGKLTSLLTAAQVTYEGHTFGGWYSEQNGGTAVTVNTVFTENKTIWAHWTPVQTDPTPGGSTFTITFDTQGGTLVGGAATTATTGTDGKLAVYPTATGETEFLGWALEEISDEYLDANHVFTDNTTIYAQWAAEEAPGSTFTITFDTQGGTLVGGAASTATTGTDGKLAVYPTATGETEFLGWALEEISDEYLDANHVFTDNTTIYAQWGVADGPDTPDNPDIPVATQKVAATEAGVCYLVGKFSGDTQFNANLGYACVADDENMPEGATHQFKLVVHLDAGDIVKFKYNKTASEQSDVWASWLDNDDGGTYETHLENFNDTDGNQNIRVKSSGTYTFYIKTYPDGGGSIWVDSFTAN